jgi:hypothetical protein
MIAFREDLYNYFGTLNEIKVGAASASKLPEKPEALLLYEQCKELGVPVFAGGIVDQPHILVQFFKICADVSTVFNAIEAANSNVTPQK